MKYIFIAIIQLFATFSGAFFAYLFNQNLNKKKYIKEHYYKRIDLLILKLNELVSFITENKNKYLNKIEIYDFLKILDTELDIMKKLLNSIEKSAKTKIEKSRIQRLKEQFFIFKKKSSNEPNFEKNDIDIEKIMNDININYLKLYEKLLIIQDTVFLKK